MKSISSKDNNLIKLATSLHIKKNRDEKNLFIIEGKTLLEEAIKKNQIIKYIFFLDTKVHKEIQNGLNPDIDCFLITEDLMKKICSTDSPCPVLAILEKKESKTEIKGDFFIYGENIKDPGNLGSIIRTAFASGVEQIFLSESSCDIYNPKTLRSTVGTIFYGEISYIKDLKTLIANLQEHANKEKLKLEIIGTSSHTQQSIFETDFQGKAIHLVLLGSEAEGLNKETINSCTQLVTIPLKNNIESINVLAASSVVLFEIAKWK